MQESLSEWDIATRRDMRVAESKAVRTAPSKPNAKSIPSLWRSSSSYGQGTNKRMEASQGKQPQFQAQNQ